MSEFEKWARGEGFWNTELRMATSYSMVGARSIADKAMMKGFRVQAERREDLGMWIVREV